MLPSSSPLALLSIPIFPPLPHTLPIPTFLILTTYQFPQYPILFLPPTPLLIATLQILNIPYSHSFPFLSPVVPFLFIFPPPLLITQLLIYS
ncbi:hypothetical protein [Staphylococcus aureus]|uniref:hypothetical protein n=1 Tax=Staphylococcus aureus TaxID=1280 RepID=UPI0037D9BB60